ncbi:MAG: cupredoxin domain-containing protein [Gammaproteobacteria bacterium]|nr:cupredoxin domain-containing protein [Gammaproteobacteria bacterium]
MLAVTSAFLLALLAPAALAADNHSVTLTIKDDSFTPSTLTVPADTRIEIEIHNTRALPSEFESFDLNREKVVPGGTTLSLWIGPLAPGKYKFFDDFNPGVTGVIVVEKPGNKTPNKTP